MIALLLLFLTPAHAQGFYQRKDHVLHTTVATGLTLMTTAMYRDLGIKKPILPAMATVMALGLIKEFAHDAYADSSDVAANAIGCATGAVLSITLDF